MKKLILLLVAIYSLIIHQSHKNIKGKISDNNTTKLAKAALNPQKFSRKDLALPARQPGYTEYISSYFILPKERKKNKYQNMFQFYDYS